MKITGFQLMVVLDALRGSLRIEDGGSHWSYNMEQRLRIYNQIIPSRATR